MSGPNPPTPPGTTPGNSSPPGNTTVAPTVAQFQADYPEFNVAQGSPFQQSFSPLAIQFWINIAVALLNQGLWGSMYYYAVEWFVAHNLALEAWTAQGGPQNVPGIAKGMIAGTAAGNVSVAYNNAAVVALDADHWNFTVYGIRMIHYIRLVGAGPRYVGAGCPPVGGWFQFAPTFGAWEGPPCFNAPCIDL